MGSRMIGFIVVAIIFYFVGVKFPQIAGKLGI